MKTSLILFISIVFMNGQNPPKAIQNAMKNNFKAAKNVFWENEKNDSWEADFRMNGRAYSALFSSDAKLLETVSELKFSEIPKKILLHIEKNYENFEFEELEQSKGKEGSFYKLTIEVDEKEVELIYTDKGSYLRSEYDEDHDEDEDEQENEEDDEDE